MDANSSAFGCVANDDIMSMKHAILIHAYTFASLFLLQVLIAAFILIRMLRANKKMKFLMTVECLVLAFGLMRAVFLSVDPYRVRDLYPPLVAQILEDLAVPCLTSAFMFVQTTFWQLTRMRRLRMQRVSVFLGTVTAHFVLIAILDVLIITVAETCTLLLVCQVLTTLWGLVLCLGFFFTVKNLHIMEREHRSTLRRRTVLGNLNLQNVSRDGSLTSTPGLSVTHEGDNNVNSVNDSSTKIQSISLAVGGNGAKQLEPQNSSTRKTGSASKTDGKAIRRSSHQRIRSINRRRNPLRKVIIVGTVTSLLGLACFGLGIYGMIVFNNPLKPVADIRGWFIYQTFQRSVEFFFGVTLSYLAWQRNSSQ